MGVAHEGDCFFVVEGVDASGGEIGGVFADGDSSWVGDHIICEVVDVCLILADYMVKLGFQEESVGLCSY